jgi:putative membrane protein
MRSRGKPAFDAGALRQEAPAKEPGMTTTDTVPGGARFEVRVTADTHFGWIRTRLSIERTMMSWVRTAVSLIGFGFAIVQFFDRMQQMPDVRSALIPGAPRYLGLSLIACGIAALVISILQYWWIVRYLSDGPFAPIAGMTREGKRSPVIAVAVLLIVIGLFAFFAVLQRMV